MPVSTQLSDDSQFTDRSIWNIVLSCLATIFASTWIAVHPNIPAPNESAVRVFGRRLAIMFYLLIVPEMVIVWTARQYLAASDIAKRHKGMWYVSLWFDTHSTDGLNSIIAKGWTKTQAFFLVMGGFSLYQDGVLLRTLEAREMEKLEEEGKIEWPTITEAEIKDKSNGDFFSKGVVVMQTTWFIIQCIARGSKRLVLTDLEVVTLAFAALTMVIYGLWWHKPLDVQVSAPVRLKKGCSADPDPKLEDEKRKTISPPVAPAGEDDDNPQTSLLGSKTLVALDVDVEAQERSKRSQLTSPEPVRDPPVSRPHHEPSLSLPQQFRVYLRAQREEFGLIGSIIYVFMIHPALMFSGAFVDMASCTTLEGKRYRVPTFYAPAVGDNDDVKCFMLAMLVATVFGGIHCIAWSFEFPTVTEKWTWRVSAVWVAGLPLGIFFYYGLTGLIIKIASYWDGKEDSSVLKNSLRTIFSVISFLLILSYIAARGVLLILPLIGLRALPAGAYIDINWTAYLPHV
ncbi:hypothetical protein CVT25_012994 [Psilocybe cyanescens]|uniref:Uncharacterized protein n=1 Tax=Psilocybe cyanescens TaxID=93625 RepID=A0A409XHJ8_PSICY|nr:hypothetical protein CVT25_012994 [Psilocybe cyanescens]